MTVNDAIAIATAALADAVCKVGFLLQIERKSESARLGCMCENFKFQSCEFEAVTTPCSDTEDSTREMRGV